MLANSYLVSVYVAYIIVATGLTVWLARMLFRSGAVFLQDVFEDNPNLAKAVNRLLVVGFYMLSMGYALMVMKTDVMGIDSAFAALELLADKLGLLLLSLAVIHFGNLYLFHRIRRRSRLRYMPPPVAHHMTLDDPEPIHAG